ncbi:MAG TPA: hypothetical protein VK655_00990 [Solirubrobacteraceae bacterium]|nr:hypothetical protein [Solirubrobacteraceae bacterium]
MTEPVIPAPQCGVQKYENVPAVVKVWVYIAPELEVAPCAQFVSFGEQKALSAAQLVPLVTLWPLAAQIHVTVSPTLIVSVLGWKASCPFGPTMTVIPLPPLLEPPLPLLDAPLLLVEPPLLLLLDAPLLLVEPPLLLLEAPLLLPEAPLLLLDAPLLLVEPPLLLLEPLDPELVELPPPSVPPSPPLLELLPHATSPMT